MFNHIYNTVDRKQAFELQKNEEVKIKGFNGKIEAGAFGDLHNIKLVDTQNIKTVKNKAFIGCRNLKEITMSYVEKLENNIFEGCISLEKVTMPNATEIGNNIFENCTSLKIVEASGNNAQLIKDKLIESNLKQQVYIYVDGAIREYLHDELTKEIISFNSKPFESNDILIPTEYVKINDEMFQGYNNVISINTNNVNTIGENVLTECNSLKIVKLPNVEEIGEGFCYNCPQLKKIITKDDLMASRVNNMLNKYDLSNRIEIYVQNESEPTYVIEKIEESGERRIIFKKEQAIETTKKICSNLIGSDIVEILSTLKIDAEKEMSEYFEKFDPITIDNVATMIMMLRMSAIKLNETNKVMLSQNDTSFNKDYIIEEIKKLKDD